MDSLQPAYLLHARDYRDTCLLVELLTEQGGRVGAVAKGARRSRRGYSQRAILQPFHPLWVNWGGRGELKNLLTVETRSPALPLRGRQLFSGLYLNELLCRLLQRDDSQPELFANYESAVTALAAGGAADIVLRHFELELLRELGYGFSITEDAATGAALQPDRRYRFDAELGLLPDEGEAGAQPVFVGRDLLAFAQGDYSDEARRALKLLCRLALRPHLGDKPLLSRQLFTAEGG